MKILLYRIILSVIVVQVISAISNSINKNKDVININGIHDSQTQHQQKEYENKDGIVTETQEKRTFFKPDADRRGTFYPSGPAGGVHSGYGSPHIHTSGNGFSYGTPSGIGPTVDYPRDYPHVVYSTSYPSSHGHSPGGSFGHSAGGSFGHSAGGTYGHSGTGTYGHSGAGTYGHSGGGTFGHISPHSGGSGYNPGLALKGLLIPIAGVALLGAAAAIAKTHPVLLQLGIIHGKKRKRRDLSSYPVNPFLKPTKK